MSLTEKRQRITARAIDAQGQRGTVGVWPQAPETATPSTAFNEWMAATRSISVAAINSVTADTLFEESSPGAPTTGVYMNVEDKAFFIFSTNAATEVVIEVPSPVAGIFKADAETIDETDALIIAFVTKVLAFAADKAGNAIIAFIRGYRARKKQRS